MAMHHGSFFDTKRIIYKRTVSRRITILACASGLAISRNNVISIIDIESWNVRW